MTTSASQETSPGTGPAVVVEDSIRIPVGAHDFDAFRRWLRSPAFPETGRIDHLEGDVEVDMSPEDLDTHGTVKTAIIAGLYELVVTTDRGQIFSDRTRVSSPLVRLSVEPDVVVVLWRSIESGRVRKIPAEGKGRGRYVELEGAPDLVVEILSDSSVRKDTQRLPKLYARTGVPELWLVDARGKEVSFEIRRLEDEAYVTMAPCADGFVESIALGAVFALSRRPGPYASWNYELQHRPQP